MKIILAIVISFILGNYATGSGINTSKLADDTNHLILELMK